MHAVQQLLVTGVHLGQALYSCAACARAASPRLAARQGRVGQQTGHAACASQTGIALRAPAARLAGLHQGAQVWPRPDRIGHPLLGQRLHAF